MILSGKLSIRFPDLLAVSASGNPKSLVIIVLACCRSHSTKYPRKRDGSTACPLYKGRRPSHADPPPSAINPGTADAVPKLPPEAAAVSYFLSSTSTNSASTTLSLGFSWPAPCAPAPSKPAPAPAPGPAPFWPAL